MVAHCHGLLLTIVNVISNTCALPTMTKQSVACEKGPLYKTRRIQQELVEFLLEVLAHNPVELCVSY